MPGSYKQVNVKCPYYRSDNGRDRIICEGLLPVTKTTSARGISRKTMMVCDKIGGAKRCFVTRPMGTRKPDCGRKNATARDRSRGQRLFY